MNLGLKDLAAIVSGGSKGIGKAITKSLAEESVNIVACARDRRFLKDVERDTQQLEGKVNTVSADVTNPEEVKKVVNTAIKLYGRLDILINNVGGVDKFSDFFHLTDADWISTFKLNVMSVVYFVRYAFPWLQKSHMARIINISSISGVEPGLYNPHYTNTKAAVINLSKHLANRFASDNILVNVVCAGPVHSNSWDRNVQNIAGIQDISLEEAKDKLEIQEAAKIPLCRVGEPEDVAGLVVFLASDKANWITGTCFHANGGKLRSMC